MDPNLAAGGDPSYNLPATQGNDGFQNLMNSLLSPMSPIGLQGYSGDLWPGAQAWQNLPLIGPGLELNPFPIAAQIPERQEHYQETVEHRWNDASFNRHEHDHESNMQWNQGPTDYQKGQPPSRSALSEQESGYDRKPQLQTQSKPPTHNTSTAAHTAMVDSKTRAAELRAKLLANRASSSKPPPSPSSRTGEGNVAQGSAVEHDLMQGLREGEKSSSIDLNVLGNGSQAVEPTNRRRTSDLSRNAAGSEKSGMSADLESLFAEARGITGKGNPNPDSRNGEPATQKSAAILVHALLSLGTNTNKTPYRDVDATDQDDSSSSDEEGEIRGTSTQPTSVDRADDPIKSIENSQDTTTESQEKMIRQTETKIAYQNLKNSGTSRRHGQTEEQSSTPKDQIASQISKVHAKSFERQEPSLQNQQGLPAPRATLNKAYDNHQAGREGRRNAETFPARVIPREGDDSMTRRKNDTTRNLSDSEQHARDVHQMIRDEMAEKRKAEIDASSRAADEYKRSLEEPQTNQKTSNKEVHRNIQRPHGQSSPKDDRRVSSKLSSGSPYICITAGNEVRANGKHSEQVRTAGKALDQPNDTIEVDIIDWLEMTEFYDTDYRQRKLARFRKKRELERQREELEREDQIEQEQRASIVRAPSTLSPPNVSVSPHALRRASLVHPQMRPPPMPLRISTATGSLVNARAPASASQTSTPLKRHHTEVDTDGTAALPAEKLARIEPLRTNDPNQPSPVISIKGESKSASYSPAVPLEQRIRPPREGQKGHRRPRSRSPYDFSHESHRHTFNTGRETHRRHSSYSPHRPAPYHFAKKPTNSHRFYESERERELHTAPCWYCKDPAHCMEDCPVSGRDDYSFEVSPNYRGNNPRPMRLLSRTLDKRDNREFVRRDSGGGGGSGSAMNQRSRASSLTR